MRSASAKSLALAKRRKQIAMKAQKPVQKRLAPSLPYQPDDLTIAEIRAAVKKVVSTP